MTSRKPLSPTTQRFQIDIESNLSHKRRDTELATQVSPYSKPMALKHVTAVKPNGRLSVKSKKPEIVVAQSPKGMLAGLKGGAPLGITSHRSMQNKVISPPKRMVVHDGNNGHEQHGAD